MLQFNGGNLMMMLLIVMHQRFRNHNFSGSWNITGTANIDLVDVDGAY